MITTTNAGDIIPQILGTVLFLIVGGLAIWGWYTWQKSAIRAEAGRWVASFGFPLSLTDIEGFAMNAVRAIEQQFRNAANEDKKQWAMDILQGFLKGSELGAGGQRELNLTALSALIEAALARLKAETAPALVAASPIAYTSLKEFVPEAHYGKANPSDRDRKEY